MVFFVDIFIFASSYIQNLNLSLFNWGLVWPSNFNNVAPNKVQLSHKKAVQFKTVHCSFSIFDANCKWNHANKNVSQHIRGWISHLVNKSSYWFWSKFSRSPPPMLWEQVRNCPILKSSPKSNLSSKANFAMPKSIWRFWIQGNFNSGKFEKEVQ